MSDETLPPLSAADLAAMPTTAYLVLGVLAVHDEELSAVEIKVRADFSLRLFYWSPAVSHIRRELGRLHRLGLVREREVRISRVRSTLLYQPTPRGDQVLQQWAETLPGSDSVMMKHPVLLKVWLGRDADPIRLVEGLDEYVGVIKEHLAQARWAERRGEDVGLHDQPHLRHPVAVHNYILRYLYSELANIQQLRDDVAGETPLDPAASFEHAHGEVRRRDAHPNGSAPVDA